MPWQTGARFEVCATQRSLLAQGPHRWMLREASSYIFILQCKCGCACLQTHASSLLRSLPQNYLFDKTNHRLKLQINTRY